MNTITWADTFNAISVLSMYTDGWDGEKATAGVTPEAVAGAMHYAETLRSIHADAPNRVIPGVNGEIMFEWLHNCSSIVIACMRIESKEKMIFYTSNPKE